MYFYCTYSIKTKILSMLGTGYFLKSQKLIPSKKNQSVLIAKISSRKTDAKISFHTVLGKMISCLINQGQGVIFGPLLASVQVYQTTFVIINYVDNYLLLLQVLSILVTTTQYQPPTKVCVANLLISEKMISFLILFVLAFFSFFTDQFLRFCPYNLSKSFSENRILSLVHWLPKS